MEDVLKDIASAGEEAANLENLRKWTKAIMDINKQYGVMVARFKDIERTGMHKHLKGIQAAANSSLGADNPWAKSRVIKYMDKIHGYRQFAHNLKEVQQARMSGSANKFRVMKDNLSSIIRPMAANRVLDIPMNEKGQVDTKALGQLIASRKGSSHKLGDFKDLAAATTAGHPRLPGLGFVDRKITQYAMRQLANGGRGSGLAASILTQGEGSGLSGIVAGTTGSFEGSLINSASKFAGPMAVAGPLLGLLRDAFDKSAKMNQEVERTLGSGGIFSGKQGGFQALSNVRSALTPGGMASFFSPLGITYEKNLKIAQAMVEGGQNVTGLAEKSPQFGKPGFMGGYFGDLQKAVYVKGRLGGFNEQQTVSQILKLVMQYRATLETSTDFFSTILKDSRAAGISTLKYVQILDDVNMQFDRMNKSLNDTVGVMRVLSFAGRGSAEDLKDYINVITGGQGGKSDLTHGAFLAIQTRKNRPAMSALHEMLQGGVDSAQQAAQRALGGVFGGDFTKDLGSLEGIGNIRQRISEKTGGVGSLQSQAIESALTRLQQALLQRERGRMIGSNPLGYAAAGQVLGENYGTSAVQRLSALSFIANQAGFGLGAFGNIGSMTKLIKHPMVPELSRSLGVEPTDLAKLPGLLQLGSSALIRGIQNRQIKEGDAAEIAKGLGIKKGKGSFVDALANYAGVDKNRQKLAEFLPKLDGTYIRLINSNDKVAQYLEKLVSQGNESLEEAKARQVAMSTRPTADIFADAFTNLFNKLLVPLEGIFKVLSIHSGPTDSQMSWYDDYFNNGGGNGAVARTVQNIQTELATLPAIKGDRSPAQQARFDELQHQLAMIQTVQQTGFSSQSQASGIQKLIGLGAPSFDYLKGQKLGEYERTQEAIRVLNRMGATPIEGGQFLLDKAQYVDNIKELTSGEKGGLVSLAPGDKPNTMKVTINHYGVGFSLNQSNIPGITKGSEHMVPSRTLVTRDPSPNQEIGKMGWKGW
jgi:hypothetical protein